MPGWRPCARAAAISRVGTRTSRCPAASKSRSSRRVIFRQSSPRKAHLGPLLGPADQRQVPLTSRRHRLVSQPTPHLVESDRGVGALVGIGPDHHQVQLPLGSSVSRSDRARRARLYRATRQVPIRPRPARHGTRRGRTSRTSHQPQARATKKRANPTGRNDHDIETKRPWVQIPHPTAGTGERYPSVSRSGVWMSLAWLVSGLGTG